MKHDERGQALPLVVLVAVLGGILAFGMTRLAVDAVALAAAQTAADAAALAGAIDGDDGAATRAARANGARVIDVKHDGDRVCVSVQRGRAEATACARPSLEPAQ